MTILFYILTTLFLGIARSLAFVPIQKRGVALPITTLATSKQHHSTTDKIVEELEELGDEIKPHLMHEKNGLNGYYHESVIHKLRRRIHTNDLHYRQKLSSIQETLARMETQLEQTNERLKETERDLQDERERHFGSTFHSLLRRTGAKVSSGTSSAVKRLLSILHLHREKQNEEEG